MSRSRPLTRTMVGITAIGALLALAACTPDPEPTPTPTATAAPETPEPEPYAGPLHFIGDELGWFLPTSDEIAATIPGAVDIAEPTASLQLISDGYGSVVQPEICGVLLSEAALGSIGARTVEWAGSAANGQDGVLHVLQFADAARAQKRMDDYVSAAEACGQFTLDGQAASFENTIIDEGDGVRAIAGTRVFDSGSGAYEHYFGVAAVGNVMVEFWHPFDGESKIDTRASAQLLRDRAQEASERLVDELTVDPPAAAEPPMTADPAAEWSAWAIGSDGIGPLSLGEDIETVVAASQGAEVVEPEGGFGEWQLIGAGGSARIHVTPQEDGTAVASIRAGDIGLYGGAPVDGSVLPRAGGVGIGDPVEDAMTAFPQGTSVHVVSAGLDFYEVSTRDGHLLLFHTDRDVAEAGAMIIGITTEDATLAREFDLGANG